jgi:hypothetical protein
MHLVQDAVHEDADIIFGTVIDESMEDRFKITVIATGFDRAARERAEQRERRARRLDTAPPRPPTDAHERPTQPTSVIEAPPVPVVDEPLAEPSAEPDLVPVFVTSDETVYAEASAAGRHQTTAAPPPAKPRGWAGRDAGAVAAADTRDAWTEDELDQPAYQRRSSGGTARRRPVVRNPWASDEDETTYDKPTFMRK